ncbi:hypothetical protein DFH08DRAFT_965791 [Mycena albidolilacea]|uniref:Uncharacterized protein n=1 Tax=Mycena albidolilacea TaxID=1033008 RepID=A0AAD7EKU3_9AGAR|nr:hypothetical protein DFH08DRAFT_965791 [Mycena albidolilacea]
MSTELAALFSTPTTPRTPVSSPAPVPDPDALHAALTGITQPPPFSYDLDMAETTRRDLTTPGWKDDDKVESFELSLKMGSYGRSWFKKLSATDKDTFKHLEAAFMKQWPEKEMAVKEKGELQEELFSFVLPPLRGNRRAHRGGGD